MSHPCAATQAPTVRDGPRPYHPPAMSSSHTTQANLLALAMLSGVVFALARGDRTAGPDHRAATPEEPEEY